jgi:hypothetical protein
MKYKLLLVVAGLLIFFANLVSLMMSYNVTSLLGHKAFIVVLIGIAIVSLNTMGLSMIYETSTNRDHDEFRSLKKFGAIVCLIFGVGGSLTLGSHGVFLLSKYNEIQEQELGTIRNNLSNIKVQKDSLIETSKNTYLNKVSELKSAAMTELNDHGAGKQYENRVESIEKFMNGNILPVPARLNGQDINSKEYKQRCIAQLNERVESLKNTWQANFTSNSKSLSDAIDNQNYSVMIGTIDNALKTWDWNEWQTSFKAKDLIIKSYTVYSNVESLVGQLRKYSASANKLTEGVDKNEIVKIENPPPSVVLSKWTEYWVNGATGFRNFTSMVEKPKGLFAISIIFALIFEILYFGVFIVFYNKRES